MCLFNPALRIPVSASALSLLDFPNNHVHHSKYGYLDEARILAGLKKMIQKSSVLSPRDVDTSRVANPANHNVHKPQEPFKIS